MENKRKKYVEKPHRFRIVCLVIGIILFLWFALPFLVAGILNIGNITGMAAATICILYMVWMPRIHEWIKKEWCHRKGKLLISGIGTIVIVIAVLVMVETGCIVSACMKAPAQNATAVVLGCRVYGERASLSLIERLEAAYDYLEENPEAVCVVSGGQGNGENISEAECMYRWLVDKGIDEARIYKEDQSTSTDENIAFSKEIIIENGLNENIAIVTSEYHTYRAGIVAAENELSFGSALGKTAIWLFPTFYVRELYAILAEWIF